MPSYVVSGSPQVTYSVTVSLTRKSATVVNVAVSCATKLQYAASSLQTGHRIIGYLWIPGVGQVEWQIKGSSEIWKGTAWHYSGSNWNISASPEVTNISGFQFAATNTYGNAGDLGWQSGFNVGVSSGLSYVQTDHSEVEITGEALSQAAATAKLSEIPQNVGYGRVINWYLGSEVIKTETVSAEEHSLDISGLLPNTSYSIKAEVRIGNSTGSIITTKAVSVVTPQETGTLILSPQSTYIAASVSEMFDSPNYDRTLEFYIKKDEDAEYALASTINEQGITSKANLTGLISNSKYDVQVLIKNGNTVLRTLTDSVETIADLSLIPTADIETISQQLGTRLCTITWITDKSVAGTTYRIEAMAEDDSDWIVLEVLNEVVSPVVVTAHEGNTLTLFRIVSVNESVAEGLANTSEEFEFYVRDDFLWDVEKVAGNPLVITANEWNRLREYAIARCTAVGITADIPIVRKGDGISADVYNTMKNNISMVSYVDVPDKRVGDAISAADIDALRLAVNNTVA